MKTNNKIGSRLRVRNELAGGVDMKALTASINTVQSAFAEYKTKNDERLAELAKGKDDVVRKDELSKIDAKMTAAQTAIDEMNRRLAIAQMAPNEDGFTTEQRAHTAAVTNYMRRGIAPAVNTASVGSDPDGGYLVGEEIEAGIDRIVGVDSVMRSIATVRSIGAASYKRLRGLGGATSGWVGETAARPETGTPTLMEMNFPTHEIYANPAATQTLLDDSRVSIESWLADEVAIEFAEEEGDAFINGNGSNKPRGLIGGYAPVANGAFSNSVPSLGYVATGVAGAFPDGGSPSSGQSDVLIDLIYAVKQRIRNGSQFLMNDLTLATIRKFKDADGNYIWQPSLAAGNPSSLLGYSVVTDDNMPVVAADAYAVAFGNFARGYLILDRVGVRILRDPYTNKPYVHFYTTKRVGGGIQDFEAIKLLKFAAA